MSAARLTVPKPTTTRHGVQTRAPGAASATGPEGAAGGVVTPRSSRAHPDDAGQSSIAATTFSGVSGRLRTRRPVAAYSALPIAAAVGPIDASPAPSEGS